MVERKEKEKLLAKEDLDPKVREKIENDVLKLDIDPKSHFAWTGGTQKILDKGRVSKYNKKFSNLRAKK